MAAERKKEPLNVHKDYPRVLRVIRDNLVKIIPENSWLFRRLASAGFDIAAKQKHRRGTSMQIDIPGLEQCHLSRICCAAFGPPEKEFLIDAAAYEKNIRRLAELTEGRLEALCFTGGEPLFHPRLAEMFETARLYFKDTEISFMTNGILLPKMPEIFWECCKRNNVCISLSGYPVRLDIDGIKQTAESYGIRFDYTGGANTPVKEMWKHSVNLHGKYKINNNFYVCDQVNSCRRMKKCLIYPCNAISLPRPVPGPSGG